MSKKVITVNPQKKAPKKKLLTLKKNAAKQASPQGKIFSSLSEKELQEIYEALCADLVYWLTYPEQQTAGHDLLDRDAMVKSDGLSRPAIHDVKQRYLDSGKVVLKTSFDYTTLVGEPVEGISPLNYKVVISESIPAKVFRVGEFLGDDFNKYSYSHFYVLKLMLEFVDKRFKDFIRNINISMERRNAETNQESNLLMRSAVNLKNLLSLLKMNTDGYTGIRLPDLFAIHPQSALLTQDLDYFKSKETQENIIEHLYTYMYSRETSQSFCAVLVELLDRKLENLEFELSNKPVITNNNPLADLNLKEWLAAMPKTKTAERMKIAFQILGIDEQDSSLEKKVSWSACELIFIFRALQRSGIIIPKLHHSKIATAMGILTGKSTDTYYNKYFDMNETEFSIQSICGVQPKVVTYTKNSIRRIALKIKSEMDILIGEIKKAEH